MANMIKFYRGLVENLPATGENGALYITTNEGAIYYGTGTGMKRLGDFIQVENVAALPEKAHESCLYYCVAENILAKWNGTEWKQINKQPTAEDMKTLLGLGSMAYKSEVAEGDLNADLAVKINAASGVQHSHDNKTVLDGITAEKVSAWDNAEKNAKDYADGKDSAMNTRVEALETAIGENGSVAGQIKTAIEALDYTDTAVDGEYVSAVNEVDGKISVTRKALPDYSNTYDAKGAAATALDNAKAYADGLAANYDEKGAAAGVKTELEAEIAKKVDKVEGKSLIADTEIARLATLANYDDTQVKADIAKKADAETVAAEIDKKVNKVEGKDLIATSEIERLATLHNYDDTQVKADIAKKADSETMTTELDKKVDKVTGYSLVSDAEIARLADVDNYDDAEVRGLIADRYTKEEADGKFALIADAYDDTALVNRVKAIEDDYLKAADKYDDAEVRGLISDNADAIDAIVADYLKAADKTALQEQITANATAINVLTNGIDADKIDGLNDLVEWAAEHAPEVKSIKEGIEANAKAIADHETLAAETYETKTDATQKLTDAKAYTDAEVAKDRARLDTLEAIDHDAYVAADATLKSELQAEIDADVKVVNDAFEAYKTSNDAEVAKKANSADVYAKTETYNKTEIEALLTWGEF